MQAGTKGRAVALEVCLIAKRTHTVHLNLMREMARMVKRGDRDCKS
jgi:hypothetical protein